MDKNRNSVEFKLTGRYALFSDPVTRIGGEKFTYQIPTYQALKGITESIYWKPTFIWYIDGVRVMKKIQTESKGIKPLKMNDGKNELSFYTYLRDVEYQILAHFEWNEHHKELDHDRNEHKHHNIAKRSVEKGGRRDIFLGTRECQGYVEPCKFGEGKSDYDDYGEISFGLQFHGYDYPDETGKNKLTVRLWEAKMNDGIIKFPMPEECSYKRIVRNMTPKKFIEGQHITFIENDLAVADLIQEG